LEIRDRYIIKLTVKIVRSAKGMLGDIKRFRREILGGFNRRDVVDYIKKLSGERDKYRGDAERLGSELKALSAEADGLRAEIRALNERDSNLRDELRTAQQRARETGNDAFDVTLRAIVEIERMYSDMRSYMTASAERMRAEMRKANDSAALMTTAFDDLSGRLDDLRTAVSAGREHLNERTDALIGDGGGERGREDIEDVAENG
jgi:chromosome segregation ATPase